MLLGEGGELGQGCTSTRLREGEGGVPGRLGKDGGGKGLGDTANGKEGAGGEWDGVHLSSVLFGLVKLLVGLEVLNPLSGDIIHLIDFICGRVNATPINWPSWVRGSEPCNIRPRATPPPIPREPSNFK
eukprot:TRINITY_DN10519_c0_g1_i3.p1 TRINITY_DN10519_c0_g1~~TRINITY_DN10519_c0_g1_i3.p1  ORF type:complete len:129 (-),score=15.18 TRINITY_DN10519_c0_g1_i3:164-550(-)